ncbi:ribosomal protein S18-alanine N-acetyltransferase [Nocardioides sp.]|uniref:ribosomal protein S18-alanine N-acetyltransferase n=1 Tax=Nocardioides sp. TaxID=35761 RepID=UPI0026073FB8|nr:ribosomal protein S18-alanine N-acetyltransferase [Nocardioides sp.]
MVAAALIRPATPEDVAAVADSELESFPGDAWTPEYLDAVVAGQLPTVRLLACEYDAVVVGHAIVSILFEDAELQRIAISPAYRRRGLARQVLHAVLALAAEEGAERMLLEVREENAPALGLYLDEGFVEIDRRERYYADGATGIVLERRLPG